MGITQHSSGVDLIAVAMCSFPYTQAVHGRSPTTPRALVSCWGVTVAASWLYHFKEFVWSALQTRYSAVVEVPLAVLVAHASALAGQHKTLPLRVPMLISTLSCTAAQPAPL